MIPYICIVTNIGTDIKKAAAILKLGECVAVPTETVYGLAANGTSPNALKKIFSTKKRPQSNPLILHFPSVERLIPYIQSFPPELMRLADYFWPGPLTLLLPKSSNVPELVTAGNERVAVRVPNHEIFLRLLNDVDFPLAAPSANLYGQLSPTCAEHVRHQLGENVAYILDGGECQNGLESTIVGEENGEVFVYRLGSISVEEISEVLGRAPLLSNALKGENIVASGMVKHHYAPVTPLFFYDVSIPVVDGDVYIFFNQSKPHIQIESQLVLSERGDLKEAASKLYAALHFMDTKQCKRIFIERFPEVGLGNSMNDRLERATYKFEALRD
jgi:L-threonylcarbamoyladenylate synthase